MTYVESDDIDIEKQVFSRKMRKTFRNEKKMKNKITYSYHHLLLQQINVFFSVQSTQTSSVFEFDQHKYSFFENRYFQHEESIRFDMIQLEHFKFIFELKFTHRLYKYLKTIAMYYMKFYKNRDLINQRKTKKNSKDHKCGSIQMMIYNEFT